MDIEEIVQQYPHQLTVKDFMTLPIKKGANLERTIKDMSDLIPEDLKEQIKVYRREIKMTKGLFKKPFIVLIELEYEPEWFS